MKTTHTRIAAVAALTSGAVAINCDKDSLQSAFSSIATVDFATWMPANSTFNVPKADIAYPTAPTQLRAACAVQTSKCKVNIIMSDDVGLMGYMTPCRLTSEGLRMCKFLSSTEKPAYFLNQSHTLIVAFPEEVTFSLVIILV
jgi:hypothetical protein